jgi:transcriptional regulator with XRE-family HTH domain
MSNQAFDAPRERFSVWITETIARKRLSARKAARELGLDTSAVTRWMQGKGLPMSPLLLRLSNWAPISPARLITMLSEDIPGGEG